MRKQSRKIVGAVALVVAGLWYLQGAVHPTSSDARSSVDIGSQQAPPALSTRLPQQKKASALESTKAPEPIDRTPAGESTPELTSLEDMVRTLSQFTKQNVPIRDLVEYLKRTRQEPIVAHSANPYSGEMAIVRTKSPLPGTRYFHAQYFTDENQQSFVQHMSFEYKPGPTAMDSAVSAVKNSFPALTEPTVRKSDFVRWELENGYILWIKKMSASDLQDDPFNAYTSADVGTIRVALEADIHGAEDH